MNMWKKYIYCLFLLMFTCHTVLAKNADDTVISTKIDSTSMYIGSQTELTFNIKLPKENKEILPELIDFLDEKIEIISSKIDSSVFNENFLNIKKTYLITAFDTGVYLIPSLPFNINGEMFYSDSLKLNIINPDIEVDETYLKDIKPLLKAPFDWYSFLINILILILVSSFLYLLYTYIKKKKSKNIIDSFEEKAAHIVALEKLENLDNKKLWQKGLEKEYYTELTDILRIYIEKRYAISAMEMISSEILEAVKKELKTDKLYDALKQILTSADFSKFANLKISSEENLSSLNNAYYFIENTKIEEIEEEITSNTIKDEAI